MSVCLNDLESNVRELYDQCLNHMNSHYASTPTHAAVGPGRVNLIGEHTDYNAGFVFPMALPQATVVACATKPDSDIIDIGTLSIKPGELVTVTFSAPTEEKPLTPGEPKWANYIKGVIVHYPGKVGGFTAVIASSVPLGGGLSSSASLEVAVFTALQAMFPVEITLVEKALLCQKAEHTFANMPCGIMDQFISTMAMKDNAILIDCESNEGRQIPLKLAGKVFLVINSNVKHELTGSEYPERRNSCAEAAKLLGVNTLRHANYDQLLEKKNSMSEMYFKRARHAITEIGRCLEAVTALEKNDATAFGKLMIASHESLRDNFEVSCSELDELVTITLSVPGVYGSRMTGGGFGGCTVTLCEQASLPEVIAAVKSQYSGTATFIECTASDGARIIELGHVNN